jgi:hypothetical protein
VRAAPGLIGLLMGLGAGLAAATAVAFPDGAPWDAAEGEGCHACHFDAPPVEASEALSLSGLPQVARPGEIYPLLIVLRVHDASRAGFLVAARQGAAPSGRFSSTDNRTEADGAEARSSLSGAELEGTGEARWALLWQAPATAAPVRFSIWANAANGDDSPLGDTTHHVERELTME